MFTDRGICDVSDSQQGHNEETENECTRTNNCYGIGTCNGGFCDFIGSPIEANTPNYPRTWTEVLRIQLKTVSNELVDKQTFGVLSDEDQTFLFLTKVSMALSYEESNKISSAERNLDLVVRQSSSACRGSGCSIGEVCIKRCQSAISCHPVGCNGCRAGCYYGSMCNKEERELLKRCPDNYWESATGVCTCTGPCYKKEFLLQSICVPDKWRGPVQNHNEMRDKCPIIFDSCSICQTDKSKCEKEIQTTSQKLQRAAVNFALRICDATFCKVIRTKNSIESKARKLYNNFLQPASCALVDHWCLKCLKSKGCN